MVFSGYSVSSTNKNDRHDIAEILLKVSLDTRGGSRGGGPKIEKNMIFWRKIVIFHTKYPNNFRASLRNWKNMIFWRKIVIFHTKYPQNFSRLPPLGAIFLSAPP